MRPTINPSTGDILAELPLATRDDLDRALESSSRAFGRWRHVAPWDRGGILKRAANLIRERVEDVATDLTLEEGKTIAEARTETLIAADIFEWCGEEARRIYGRIVPARQPGQRQLVLREPVGPVAAFAPWNFPAITPARKIAAALAAGCSCIIKPAEETPATALALARALADAGLQAGVLNVVFGDPDRVSTHLLSSPIVRKLSFTGSTVVGRRLARLSADVIRPSTLELGGHAPVLIFDDVDPAQLIEASMAWKFRNAGQVCTAPTRYYVQDSVFEGFVDGMARAARAFQVGNGLDRGNRMGSLANPRRLAAMQELVADAILAGGELRAGGERIGSDGLFWTPTILANVPDSARMMREEPFGPVALINRFSTFEEAIERANALPYGLAAYAFTGSLKTASALGDELQSGMIGINSYSVAAPDTPFGGVKDSGYGSEGGAEALSGYLQTKYVNQFSL
jgi:succinate-semialdehyde dehydrogenase/glutarate-semialdehyde dehydrogenase